MIEFGGVIPERENLPYYLISIKWFRRWQKYTGCLKIESDSEDEVLPVKDKSRIILGDHPGEINPAEEVKQIAYLGNKNTGNISIFTPEDDYFGRTYLRQGKKEE